MPEDEEKTAEDLMVWIDRLRVQLQSRLPPSRIEGINPGKQRQRP